MPRLDSTPKYNRYWTDADHKLAKLWEKHKSVTILMKETGKSRMDIEDHLEVIGKRRRPVSFHKRRWAEREIKEE